MRPRSVAVFNGKPFKRENFHNPDRCLVRSQRQSSTGVLNGYSPGVHSR